MDYRILGRTNIKVSTISLGTGGHSRIGQSTGKTLEQSIYIIKRAINEGINLIDTSEMYDTEELVGAAVSELGRDEVILSTKGNIYVGENLKTSLQFEKSLEGSLKRLKTDYIDIYHLHGILDKDYDRAVKEFIPVLLKLKKQGKLRFIGITERFEMDPSHIMLQRAVLDEYWDVIMTGFNLLNQSARDSVIKPSLKRNIGILNMFAVRRTLADKDLLINLLSELILKGSIDKNNIDLSDPLGFLFHDNGCNSLTEAAYRFCLSEPHIHSILSGTGDPQHLIENIHDIQKGPLPEKDRDRLISIFKDIDSVSGN